MAKAEPTAFERECLDMIEKLETVALARATQRLVAAQRAVERAKGEIEAFRVTLQVHRELNEQEAPADAHE
jgi:hypothetical protein